MSNISKIAFFATLEKTKHQNLKDLKPGLKFLLFENEIDSYSDLLRSYTENKKQV